MEANRYRIYSSAKVHEGKKTVAMAEVEMENLQP